MFNSPFALVLVLLALALVLCMAQVQHGTVWYSVVLRRCEVYCCTVQVLAPAIWSRAAPSTASTVPMIDNFFS